VTTDTGAGVERALSTCYTETDARFEFSDELSRETYGYIYYLRHGDGYDVVGFGDANIIYSLELDAPVVKHWHRPG
jgi:hypothetical protein